MTQATVTPSTTPAVVAPKGKKAGAVVITLDDAAKTHIATMLDAVINEALARDNAQTIIESAGSSTWATLRDETLATLKDDTSFAKAYTLAMLTQFAKEATEAELPRGKQYASNLKRAAKLAAKGIELPAELYTAGRSAWNEHEVWSQNGVLAATSSGPAIDEEGNAATREAIEARANGIADAVANVLEDYREVAEALRGIPEGQFRDEAVAAALEAIANVKRRYTLATGGSRA